MILFDGSANDSLHVVSASGGRATPVTRLNHDKAEIYHAWPEFLPDGNHFLYLASSDTLLDNQSSYILYVGFVDSDETIELFPATSKVEYCEPGFLVYVRDKILLAQAFDVDALKVTGEPIPIAAAHNRGVRSLIEGILANFVPDEEYEEDQQGIKVAIVGRPNVGKSTLVNRIMGEERVVVFDMPGSTRDSIYIPFERDDKKYTLIDTAGVRRRARVKQTVEKFSVIKTLQAIDDAHGGK